MSGYGWSQAILKIDRTEAGNHGERRRAQHGLRSCRQPGIGRRSHLMPMANPLMGTVFIAVPGRQAAPVLIGGHDTHAAGRIGRASR